MEPGVEKEGFDAHFISDIPDYLNCIVCHLVLRKPLQISSCGHKFCKPCFEKLKTHSNNTGTPLQCPVDRGVIDLRTVFEDKGMGMVIGNLMVKCSCFEDGCPWSGCLSDLETHEARCKYRQLSEGPPSGVDKFVAEALKELRLRLDKCEEELKEKDKDIAMLRFSLQETKQCNDERITKLEELNRSYKEELELLKSRCIKQLETLEDLTVKNIILEERMALLSEIEDGRLEISVPYKSQENVKETKQEIDGKIAIIENDLKNQNEEMNRFKDTLNDFKKQSATKDDLSSLKRSFLPTWHRRFDKNRKMETCIWGAHISCLNESHNTRSPAFLCCLFGYPTRLTLTSERGKLVLLIGWSGCDGVQNYPAVTLSIDVDILYGTNLTSGKKIHSGTAFYDGWNKNHICSIPETIYKNLFQDNILYLKVMWKCTH